MSDAGRNCRVPSYGSEMAVKLDLMRDLFDAIHRAICKKLAIDAEGDFAAWEYAVEAFISTFYRES
jgi:hypothetical protein